VRRPRLAAVPAVVIAGVTLVLATGALMVHRAEARINRVSLAANPQPVSVARAKAAMYRASRTYAGTFQSWVESSVGPQFLSAYVETVLVRPGAVVRRGDVLATLDCRNANASTRAVSMQARAIASEQAAVAHEAARQQTMVEGGFVSPNEAELTAARSAEQEARLAAQVATLAQASLVANDCVLRAPFDGEVSSRTLDPGAFVRPGAAIVMLIDRDTVRLVAEAPESDFDVVNSGTALRVHVYATGNDVVGIVARRAPSTDPETRTVHFEIDVPDPKREIPSNTTGEVYIEAGQPVSATEIPLYAALVRGTRATVFVVEGDRIRRATFEAKGEVGGSLFLDTSLSPGTPVVLEGRELLEDGDVVSTTETSSGQGAR
jgi:membrane fusion protein (multidrug efflux system)